MRPAAWTSRAGTQSRHEKQPKRRHPWLVSIRPWWPSASRRPDSQVASSARPSWAPAQQPLTLPRSPAPLPQVVPQRPQPHGDERVVPGAGHGILRCRLPGERPRRRTLPHRLGRLRGLRTRTDKLGYETGLPGDRSRQQACRRAMSLLNLARRPLSGRPARPRSGRSRRPGGPPAPGGPGWRRHRPGPPPRSCRCPC